MVFQGGSPMNEIFAEQVSAYFRHFRNELEITNKSPYTIISYNTTISSFIEFIKQYKNSITFETFKKIDLMNFLEYKNEMLQKQSELKATSKRLYVTHLKTFFTYVQDNMDVELKISKIFKVVIKAPKRTPKGIDDKNVELFESYLNSMSHSTFTNIRNSLIMKILFYTGARRGELSNIKIDSETIIDKGRYYIIRTIGKGDKERVLYVKKDYIEDELEYFRNNNILHVSSTKSGRVMSGTEIYLMINAHYKRAGIGNEYSGAHILRHTFAKHEYAKNKDIVKLQKRLGHANVNTTMIYADPTQKELEKAFAEEMLEG